MLTFPSPNFPEDPSCLPAPLIWQQKTPLKFPPHTLASERSSLLVPSSPKKPNRYQRAHLPSPFIPTLPKKKNRSPKAPSPLFLITDAPYVVMTNCGHRGQVGLFKGLTESGKVRLFFEDENRTYPFDKASVRELDPYSDAALLRAVKPEIKTREIPVCVPPSPAGMPPPSRNVVAPSDDFQPESGSVAGPTIPRYKPEDGYDRSSSSNPARKPGVPPLFSPNSWQDDLVLDRALDGLVDAMCRQGLSPSDDTIVRLLATKYKARVRSNYHASAPAT
jgi:hypothetical protein